MCPSRRGDWWFRLSVDMEHLGQVDTALEVGMCVGFVFHYSNCLKWCERGTIRCILLIVC